MKRKFIQTFLLVLFSATITTIASNSSNIVSAKESEPKECYSDGLFYVNHYLFYSNGAMRSLNNFANDTYNFATDSEFDSKVKSLSDKFLPNVIYNETDAMKSKVGEDNLSMLESIYNMPSTGYHYLTNYTDEQLKEKGLLPEDDLQEAIDQTNGTTDIESISSISENIIDNGDATTSELVSAASYLISKDYFTLPRTITLHKAKRGSAPSAELKVNSTWIDAYRNSDTNMRKSDLIMTLSKIFTGVKPSATIVLEDLSYRKGSVWTTVDPNAPVTPGSSSRSYDGKSGVDYYGSSNDYYGGDAHWPYPNEWSGETHKCVQFMGDYWVYYDPNVYELYLSEALNDGIISVSDLADSKFKTDYKNQSTGNWGSNAILSGDQIKTDSLGYSINVKDSSGYFMVSQSKPTYFGDNETMTVIEALRLIEAYMRANDENMSDVEEEIIRYKFGLTVLDYMSSADQKTITYLIATGILDSDDLSLISSLNDDASIAKILPLLYRAANKNARYDFSKVQLTDSETYWVNKGFAGNSFSVIQQDTDVIHDTGTVEVVKKRVRKNTASVDTMSTSLKGASQSSPFLLSANAATKIDDVKTYNVTKYFDKKTVYKVGTTTIAKIVKSQDKNAMKEASIISATEEKDYEYGGKKHNVYKVVFQVNATTASAALSAVERKYKALSDLDAKKKTLAGVTKLSKTDDTASLSLVSQDSLKQSFSNIAVLEDKVLMNTVTGTMAYFSYDNKIAIVGSQVISCGYSCIVKTDDGVYYNLKALLPLLSSAYVDIIGPQLNVVVKDIEHTNSIAISTDLTDASDYPLRAEYMKVYSRGSKSTPDNDAYGFSCIATEDSKNKLDNAKESYSTDYFMKLNTLSTSANKITKSFSVNYNGTKVTGTIILDLQYVVPDVDEFSSWLNAQVFNTSTYTYQEASEILNTPPDQLSNKLGLNLNTKTLSKLSKSSLTSWWYSNYGMSNALCNCLFETSGQVYVHSGYVCPSICLLIDNVGTKSFETWCKKAGNNERNLRDAIFDKIFDGFVLGEDYQKYNADSSKRFWHNYYQMDSDNPSYTGFENAKKEVISAITNSRTFSVYCQYGSTTLKKNAFGKVATDQSFKNYGTRFGVSGAGCVYESIDTLGSAKQPMFSYSFSVKNGQRGKLTSLKINSRTVKPIELNRGQAIYCGSKTLRYDSTKTTKDVKKYYGLYPESLFDGTQCKLTCCKMQLRKLNAKYTLDIETTQNSKTSYTNIVSSKFLSTIYPANYRTIFGQNDTCPTASELETIIKSGSGNLFVDPSMISSKTSMMKKIFGTKPLYIYTDKSDSDENSLLYVPGRIYYWDGAKLSKCTNASVTNVFVNKTPVYAIPLYLAPSDSFFFETDSVGNIKLGSNILCKALNYLQYDLTSLNNQLIETYLDEKQGVVSINKLQDGTTVMIGDTVWVKKGDWFQSKPIHDSKNARVAISKSKDMMWYSNILFAGMYVSYQGHRYSVQAYCKEMTMGEEVGTSDQIKRGIIFKGSSNVCIRKGNTVKKATAKSKAQYLSVKCKFNDALLVRPLNSEKTKYTYLGYSNHGMISSADYPFFDMDASWPKERVENYTINKTQFKPSAAYQAAKNTFLSEFKQALVEDTWNYVWVVIIILASYLLIMSWFSYGVLTLGVGRAGFETIAMLDRRSGKKGLDLIKIATFGLYSLDKELSLSRMVIVSFGCCIVIITILIVIF